MQLMILPVQSAFIFWHARIGGLAASHQQTEVNPALLQVALDRVARMMSESGVPDKDGQPHLDSSTVGIQRVLG